MRSEDKKRFVQAIAGMASVKGRELTDEALEMWWLSMQDWQIDDFVGAAAHLLKTCEFMPAPNDFESLRKKVTFSAREAWAEAICFASGDWRSRGHEDALIQRTVMALGGWQSIALCDYQSLGFIERRFLSIYDEFVESADIREALPNLTDSSSVRIGKATPVANIVGEVPKSA